MTHLRWRHGSIEGDDKVALLQTDLPNRSRSFGWLEYYEVFHHSHTDYDVNSPKFSLPDGWYANYYHFDPIEGGRRLLVQAGVASALATSKEAMTACEEHYARRLASKADSDRKEDEAA